MPADLEPEFIIVQEEIDNSDLEVVFTDLESIQVGDRITNKDGTNYRAASIGTVESICEDEAIIAWDDNPFEPVAWRTYKLTGITKTLPITPVKSSTPFVPHRTLADVGLVFGKKYTIRKGHYDDVKLVKSGRGGSTLYALEGIVIPIHLSPEGLVTVELVKFVAEAPVRAKKNSAGTASASRQIQFYWVDPLQLEPCKN
jgi:hypothetical protein